MDRRAEERKVPDSPSTVELTFRSRRLKGRLADASTHGARISFELEDYASAYDLLDEALDARKPICLQIDGEPQPRVAILAWHALSFKGGFAVGVQFVGTGPSQLDERSGIPAPVPFTEFYPQPSPKSGLAGALNDFFHHISSADFALESALQLLCDRVRELVGAEGVTFWAVEKGQLVLGAQSGVLQLDFGSRLPQAGQRVAGIEEGRSLVTSQSSVLQSVMVIPVFGQEVDFGLLVLGHSRNPLAFGEEQHAVAELFASQAALFLEKVQMVGKLLQWSSFLESMLRIGLACHQRLDLDYVLNVICVESRALFQVDLASIFLLEGETYVQRAAAGMKLSRQWVDASLPEVQRMNPGEGFFINDVEENPVSRQEFVQQWGEGKLAKSVMVIPIGEPGQVLGALLVGDLGNPGRFTSQDLEKGKLFGQQAGQALANARLFKQVVESKRILCQQDRFRILGELATVLTHEIKNLLVPLRTAVELLPRQYDDAEFREWYERTVPREVERMCDLVSQLGRFRRVKAQPSTPLDPLQVAKQLVELMRLEARSRKIAIEFEGEAVPAIRVVTEELRQVLLNLILNAIEAIGENGVVRVGVRHSEAQGSTLFWVSDTGSGIPPDDLEKIFDPLYTTKENGSGLGLAVSRDLVKAWGGRLEVQSAPGVGAAFTVILPDQKPLQAPTDEAAAACG